MSAFFLLILLEKISFAKHLDIPITKDPDTYVTINDLNQFKIGFLIFAISTLVSLIKFVWGLFRDKDAELKKMIKELSDSQLDKHQVTEIVREVVRHEIDYIEKLRSR